MNLDNVLTHWRYFLSLEKDMEILKNYVEIKEDNFATYSAELSKLLQLSCSEIDSVCRLLCNHLDPNTDYFDESTRSGNISLYRTVITRRFPNLHKTEILVPGLSQPLFPWEDWVSRNCPDWWDSYNHVKHYRHNCFQEASLKNTLYSMSALMVIILYLYRSLANESKANPVPQPNFFESKYTSPTLIDGPDKELPDF